MKFHATVVLEFNAPDVGEAGKRLNELLEHAAERELDTRSLELLHGAGHTRHVAAGRVRVMKITYLASAGTADPTRAARAREE